MQSTDKRCAQCKSTCHLQYNNSAFEEQSFLFKSPITALTLWRMVLQQHRTGLRESRLWRNYCMYGIHEPSFYTILAYWPYSCKNIHLPHLFGVGLGSVKPPSFWYSDNLGIPFCVSIAWGLNALHFCESLAGQHVLGNLCRFWFIAQAGEVLFWRALGILVLISLVLQRQNESNLHFFLQKE